MVIVSCDAEASSMFNCHQRSFPDRLRLDVETRCSYDL